MNKSSRFKILFIFISLILGNVGCLQFDSRPLIDEPLDGLSVSDQSVMNQNRIDRDPPNQNQMDQSLPNQDMNNQDMNDQELTQQDMFDQEGSDQEIPDQEIPDQSQEEECNNQDDDGDGEVDEGPLINAPLCFRQAGICEGARMTECVDGAWVECGENEYGQYYEAVEETCDCLDNDCDGRVDQTGIYPLGCTFQELADKEKQIREEGTPPGRPRICVVQVGGSIDSGHYIFENLMIPSGTTLEVNPVDPATGTACGYQGMGNCMKAGGCLTLQAKKMEISGRIHVDAESYVDAESNPSEAMNCGGSSGGDLVLYAHELEISNGYLRTLGSDGAHSTVSCGGGAGGSIRIRAHSTRLMNGSTIKSMGGNASYDSEAGEYRGREGGGPGGPGGAGGGGGSGSAGLATRVGEDNPERPIEILGTFERDDDSHVFGFKGNMGQAEYVHDGFIHLGGQATSPAWTYFAPYRVTSYVAVLHIFNESGEPYPSTLVKLSKREIGPNGPSQQSHDEFIGTTEEDGWLKTSFDLIAPGDRYQYAFQFEGLSQVSGELFWSYYRNDFTQCTQRARFENGTYILPSFESCNATPFTVDED